MKILYGLLLAMCLVLGNQTSYAANKNHQTAQRATFVLYRRSVSHHHVEDYELCTAFIYKKAPDGYVLMTAGHCLQPDAPKDASYFVAEGQLVSDPKLQPVEVLNAVDDGVMDVAELHLKTDKQYPILELDEKPTEIDDEVFYVGYPKMVSQVVFTGRVAGELMQKPCGNEDNDDTCVGRFLVQIGGAGGASGSPVISERTGKVVGILEGHEFENGIAVVPAPAIENYYSKTGHLAIKKKV